MITKEQLQTMSDFEVNKALAGMIYGYPEDKDIARRVHSGAIDFCNTPNDIMPLAFEHKLALMPMIASNKWASGGGDGLGYSDVKPLRAIACCLILVLQEGKK